MRAVDSSVSTPGRPGSMSSAMANYADGRTASAGSFPFTKLDPFARDQDALAHADVFGRHLDQFVVFDEVQALLQRHLARRHELDRGIFRGGAHVCLLLLLGGVDVDVAGAPVEADDHAFVDGGAGPDERLAALLDAGQSVSDRRPCLTRGEYPIARTGRKVTPGLPSDDAGGHHAGSTRQGQNEAA